MTDDPNPLDDDAEGTPVARIAAALLGVLAILPTIALALLMSTMLRDTAAGQMTPVALLMAIGAMVLLPVGVALLFFGRREAVGVFVLAALAGLAGLGGPFGRVTACAAIVAVIGAGMAHLQRPRR